ncbi:MAG: pseudouridine synthase [Succinivibrio sp.]|jgi:16S rRNA pseudouridine516 synthase|nr:pseudouridine synthase [Succinivibrio sp.]
MAEKLLRLDKAVAHTFDLSRSEAARIIREGLVEAGGEVISDPAAKVAMDAVLSLDGNEGSASEAFAPRIFMLNKPAGMVCADRDSSHPLVLSLFSSEVRCETLHCVGRLDADTTGLLLVTDDGLYSHNVTSPKKGVVKVYEAQVLKDLREADVAAFARGLKHPEEQERYRSAVLQITGPRTALVSVTEGRFHEVKRLFECTDNEVVALKRLKIGTLELDPELDEGAYRLLSPAEAQLVFSAC